MRKFTVKNMPSTVVFQFSKDLYVWKIMREKLRSGNVLSKEPRFFLEIFRMEKEGFLSCISSGLLITSSSYDESGLDQNHAFHIFDYDRDREVTFKQERNLTIAPGEIQEMVWNLGTDDIKIK